MPLRCSFIQNIKDFLGQLRSNWSRTQSVIIWYYHTSSNKVETPKQNIITLESINKEKLGEFIAVIKRQRPPEPYKGKGIKRKGEYVQRKEGKKG